MPFVPPVMLRRTALLMVVSGACTSSSIPEYELENAHGKADGATGALIPLTREHPRAALLFECAEQPACDITFGLEYVTRLANGAPLYEQMWSAISPDAVAARLHGGDVRLLFTRLLEPDGTPHQDFLYRTWEVGEANQFAPGTDIRYERLPPGNYVLTVETLLLDANFKMFAAWTASPCETP